MDHGSGQKKRQVADVVGLAALKHLDRLAHFVPVSDGLTERLIHVRQIRDGLFPGGFADGDQRPGQFQSAFFRFHEGSRSKFHIQHKGVDAFGQFLAHDARRDERNTFDGSGDVAKGVHPLVGRGDVFGLADQHQIVRSQHLAIPIQIQVHIEAGDGFELVEGATRVTQPPPRNHRHRNAARRHDGRQNEGKLIANTSRGVFIDLDAGDVRQIEHNARVQHGVAQCRRFLRVQSIEISSHEKGRHLVIGDAIERIFLNEPTDVVGTQRVAIAFLANQTDGVVRNHGPVYFDLK